MRRFKLYDAQNCSKKSIRYLCVHITKNNKIIKINKI